MESTAQQLAEFLAAVAAAQSERQALDHAVERIAEVFEAEICALVEGDRLVHAIGFGTRHDPEPVLAAARGTSRVVSVPGAGECLASVAPVEVGEGSVLVVARAGDPLFAEEVSLLRGMSRVLSLALRMLRTIDRERSLLERLQERQRLATHLSRIERSISARRPLQETLDTITQSAADLFGDEVVGLRIVDQHDAHYLRMISSVGVERSVADELQRTPITSGIGGRAIREDRLVVVEHYRSEDDAHPVFVAEGLEAAMAAPVHEAGQPIGSLVVATHRRGRHYTEIEQEMLIAFAEHVSLALNDAMALRQLDVALEDAVHRAMHDALTGLPNRALLRDRLEHAIARGARTGTHVALAFVDLDDFKSVNDVHGHVVGDQLLMTIAERLLEATRPGDTTARLGGDEFAVLLEDVQSESDALTAIQRVLPVLSRRARVDGHDLVITGSIGVAISDADCDAGELLRRADLAMYEAKTLGKNRAALFEPKMHHAAGERVALIGDLRRAIEDEQLEVEYQPIVSLQTGDVTGVEALVRWNHPTRGALPPTAFVPLAEERDLIEPLGRLVLQKSVRQLQALDELTAGATRSLHLSVNLSPRQLLHPSCIDGLLDVLDRSRLDPRRLTFELTESVLLYDDDLTRSKLRRLRDRGVRIAIDDFGTGYSSLSYLSRFDVDILKIDRSFVADLLETRGSRSLVGAIVNLGASLDLVTVAEGVETPAQLELLRSLGCRLAQGFLLGRPMDGAALEARLAPTAATPAAVV